MHRLLVKLMFNRAEKFVMKKFLIFSLVMITAICFSTVYGQSEETSLSPVVTELIGLTPEQELEVYEIMSRGPNGHWCGESVDLGVGKGILCWYRENYNFQATFKPLEVPLPNERMPSSG